MLRLGLVGLLGLVVAWGFQSYNQPADVPAASDETPRSAADDRQFEILRDAINLPADPALAELFTEINARHFQSHLAPIPVVWEPRLVDVGRLAQDAFSLEGMYGHIGERAIILLNPTLASDPDAIRRALAHEMVHAWLHSIGEQSTGHGPAFQMVLKRLATEGAFSGLAATDGERDALREWLESESSRLDSLAAQTQREGDTLALEARELEQQAGELDDASVPSTDASPSVVAWRHRRDTYNQRVQELRDRAARLEREVASFNAQVERYNLMTIYPRGLDTPP